MTFHIQREIKQNKLDKYIYILINNKSNRTIGSTFDLCTFEIKFENTYILETSFLSTYMGNSVFCIKYAYLGGYRLSFMHFVEKNLNILHYQEVLMKISRRSNHAVESYRTQRTDGRYTHPKAHGCNQLSTFDSLRCKRNCMHLLLET